MENFNIVFWHTLSFATMTLKLKFRFLIYFLDQCTNGHYKLYKSVYIKGLLFFVYVLQFTFIMAYLSGMKKTCLFHQLWIFFFTSLMFENKHQLQRSVLIVVALMGTLDLAHFA